MRGMSVKPIRGLAMNEIILTRIASKIGVPLHVSHFLIASISFVCPRHAVALHEWTKAHVGSIGQQR